MENRSSKKVKIDKPYINMMNHWKGKSKEIFGDSIKIEIKDRKKYPQLKYTFKTIILIFLIIPLSGCAVYQYGNHDNEEQYVFFSNESRDKNAGYIKQTQHNYLYDKSQKYMNKSQAELLRIAGTPDKIITTIDLREGTWNEKIFWMYKIEKRDHVPFFFGGGSTQEIILEFNKSERVTSVEFFDKSSSWSVFYPNWVSE